MRLAPRAATLALALLTVIPMVASGGDPPVVPFAEVRQGMEGRGLTVLSGHEMTPFSAEVLGTVDSGAGQPRMIVCRLKGAGLEQSGVLAAMSGSPVYVGERFLGAVAFSWAFSREPICGLTPAEDLLAVRSRSAGGAARGSAQDLARPAVTPASFADRLASGTLRGGISRPEADRTSGLPAALRDAGFDWAVSPSGEHAALGIQEPPGPGGMIGVQLVGGDAQLTAFGTVAWTREGEFLAFGHPFLGLGAVEMPVVGARVVAPVPSYQRGFKLCAPESPLGAVLEDRSTGVFGRFGRAADTLPVTLRLQDPTLGERTFHFEVVRHRWLTPALVGASLGALWAAWEGPADLRTVTVREMTLAPAGGPPVTLRPQGFSGPSAAPSAFDLVTSVLDLLLNNPREAVTLERLDLTLALGDDGRGTTVESAWLDRSSAVRGETVRLFARLEDFRGRTRVVSLPIPTSGFPAGTVKVSAGGALSLLKTYTAARPGSPEDARGYLDYLADIPSNDGLLVLATAQGQGVTLGSRKLPALPPSVASLLGAGPRAAAETADPAILCWSGSVPANSPVEGSVELTLELKEEGHDAP